MIFPDTVIQERKNRVAKALNTILSSDDVVLVHAGLPLHKPGGHDQTYPYLPHPDYFWLTGHRRAGGISAYSKSEGWIDFVEPVTRDEKVWEGGGETLPGKDLKSFQNWLTSKKFNRTFTLGQHQDSISVDPSRDTEGVLEFYNEVRRVKDAHEIELIKKIAGISHKGYEAIQHFIKAGVSEKDIQIEYESTVLRHGSEKFPYGTIVGTGSNAAILHASPSARIVQKGEMVLIDAGADIEDYCVDITRVFPADGTFSDQQKMIYETVLKAQEASIELCRPGVEWKDVHLASARVIAEGLKDMGILKCNVEESLETAAVSLFFPHGVGHMVGLRVRDVGGKFNPNPRKYAGARLRVDMPLKEGYLMTVEPGLYFIEALLNDEETRILYKSQVNWDELKHWKEIGGVRLEDDIHVTAHDPVNLTSIVPK
jgi:Xaa-Pro aminopeptidase